MSGTILLVAILGSVVCGIGLYAKLLRSDYIKQLGPFARTAVVLVGCFLFGLVARIIGLGGDGGAWIAGLLCALAYIIATPWIWANESKK
jgi:hypothetical protein